VRHKKGTWVAGAWAIAIASIAVPCSKVLSASPMIQYVPKNAILYVGLAGKLQQWPGYQGSNMQLLISHSRRLQKLLKKVDAKTLEQGSPTNSDAVFHYPIALYVTSFNGVKNNNPEGNLGLLVDAGTHWKQVLKLFNSSKLANGEKRGHVGGIVYDIYHATPAELKLCYGGDVADSLAANPRYQALTHGLGSMSANAWYADMAQVSSDLLNAKYHSPVDQVLPLLRKLYAGLSLSNYTAIAGGGGFAGKNYVYHMRASMAKPSKNDTAGLKRLLSFVPQNAVSVATFHFDLQAIFKTVLKVGKQAGFETKIKQGLSEAGALAGISLRRDLINALGGRWVDFSIPDSMGTYTSVYEGILRKPTKVANALASIAPMALMAINSGMQQSNPNAKPLTLTTHTVGNDTVYGIQASHLYWCIAGHRLIIGSALNTIKPQLTRHLMAKTIMQNSKFAVVYKQFAQDHGLTDISWVESHKLMPQSYVFLVETLRALDAKYPKLNKFLRPGLLPRLSLLQKYMRFSSSAQWYTAHHWQLAIHSSLPGGDLLTPRAGAFLTEALNPLTGRLFGMVLVASFLTHETNVSHAAAHSSPQPAATPVGGQ